MRVLLDTNVLISAFIARGACTDLLEYCAVSHDLVSCEALLEEFRAVLIDKFHFASGQVDRAVVLLRGRLRIVVPADTPAGTCRDGDDLVVLGTAAAGECDCLVTGDRDLLSLERYGGVVILSPEAFWRYEATRERGGGEE
ncbi:MAG: putative toxin-antitoxin system toxin component, PIN family [Planctomycetes bacterium]|nr:putative toxin-antitoxin system toxin component, PIN family [Planctomycetota bacterium]